MSAKRRWQNITERAQMAHFTGGARMAEDHVSGVTWGCQYQRHPRARDRARAVSKGLQTQQPPVVNDN